jgi:hypothetical protein
MAPGIFRVYPGIIPNWVWVLKTNNVTSTTLSLSFSYSKALPLVLSKTLSFFPVQSLYLLKLFNFYLKKILYQIFWFDSLFFSRINIFRLLGHLCSTDCHSMALSFRSYLFFIFEVRNNFLCHLDSNHQIFR